MRFVGSSVCGGSSWPLLQLVLSSISALPCCTELSLASVVLRWCWPQLIAEYSQLPGKSLLEAAGPSGRGRGPLRLSGRLTLCADGQVKRHLGEEGPVLREERPRLGRHKISGLRIAWRIPLENSGLHTQSRGALNCPIT